MQLKKVVFLLALPLVAFVSVRAQGTKVSDEQKRLLVVLIDQYAQAREQRDTVLLKSILTEDVDQLVSTGEWRVGLSSAVEGMLKSSATSPGTRTLTVDKIQLLNASAAIVDCRYEIQNADGTVRKMWSAFIVIMEGKLWKIRAIRNMLPAHR